MTGPATLEHDGDVAVITLDDGKANALGFDTLESLNAAFDEAEKAKAVVLAGREGRFCAGFDLSVMQSDRILDLMRAGVSLPMRMVQFPVPLVFAVTGHALAMGAVILMTPDWRVAAAGDFKLGLNEVRIGLFVPDFAAELARERLDPRHLNEAAQLAKVYDPEGAREAGFVDEVVPPGEVVDRAIERAKEFADTLDPAAFARTREILRADLIRRLQASIEAAA